MSNFTGILKGKKGACMAMKEEGEKNWQKQYYVKKLPKLKALHPYWFYTWGIKPPNGVETKAEADGLKIAAKEGSANPLIDFLPMIWGCNKHFKEQQKEVQQQTPRLVLSFNEPDHKNQSNLSVERVIDVWPELENSFKDATVLVSPSAGNPVKPWFESFMKQVDEKGLRVDVIGVHHYGGPNANGFKDKMKKVYKKCNRPLLITEFAVADWDAKTPADNKYTPAQALQFMKEVLPWMEEQDWILGYAWFSFQIDLPAGTSSALFDKDDKLTALGEYYSAFCG